MENLEMKIEWTNHTSFPLQLRFQLTESEMTTFCLYLSMLKYDLIPVIIPSGQPLRIVKLTKKQTSKLPGNHKGYGLRMPNNELELRLTESVLDDWIKSYLVYYRDDGMKVDHFDDWFHVDSQHPSSIPISLTFMLPAK